MTDLNYTSALALSASIEASNLSIPELMQSNLDRIDAVNGDVNAIVSLRDPEILMAEAHVAQSEQRKGWLHDIPIAIKDLANAAGVVITIRSLLLEDEVVQKDDIVIGKTNTPEFGLGSHTFNPVFGVIKTPI